MTDDALHLNWVLQESLMRLVLSFQVITNNDTELAFSHLWSLDAGINLLRNDLC